MNRLLLVVGATAVMALGAASVNAQQQGPADKGGGQPMQGAPGGQMPGAGGQSPKGEGPAQKGAEKSEPKGMSEKGAAQGRDEPGKGTAQKGAEPRDKAPRGRAEKGADPKDKATKGRAEKGADPKDKATKGRAEKGADPKDKATKGRAEKGADPKDKATKGTAEKGADPKDKATKGTAEKGADPKDKATKGTAEKGAEPKDKATAERSRDRVRVSEQERTRVSQTLLKDRRVNRVTNVNFSINVGTRVPRSVHLVALPASVISIVPAYREYRYFVVDEQICIVDPATYEIVDVIVVSDRTAGGPGPGKASAKLVLTDEERAIILRQVDVSGGSTLALGALTEGSDVPRDVELHVFSDEIVEKVPKVKGYRFVATENRVAIIEPQSTKVTLVIEERR